MLISTSKAAPPSSIGIAADTRSANGLRCGFTGNAFAPRSFTVLRIMLDAPKPATKSLQPTEQSYGRWHVLPSAPVSDPSCPALCSLQSEKTYQLHPALHPRVPSRYSRPLGMLF